MIKSDCGVFVLKVCDIVFLREERGKKAIILFCINHIIVSVDCGVHCKDSTFHVTFDKVSTSLPADVLWGSFVTHSFLPHGRLLNRADIYVLDCLNKPISG